MKNPFFNAMPSTVAPLLFIYLASHGVGAQEVPVDPRKGADEIRERIGALHERQAEYFRKVTAGEIVPGKDLREQLPQIREKVAALREMIVALNAMEPGSPGLPAEESKLFNALQPVGVHLVNASHPQFSPRVLDAAKIAEMRGIESAIAGMKFGERKDARPVEVLTPDPSFTFIHLPVPIIVRCQPDGIVYLAATTGGAFHNGLSLVALQADERGMAKTTWVSIGDAVADCHVSVYSEAAIEPREIRIKVVSPSLPAIDNVPDAGQLRGETLRIRSKVTETEGRALRLIE